MSETQANLFRQIRQARSTDSGEPIVEEPAIAKLSKPKSSQRKTSQREASQKQATEPSQPTRANTGKRSTSRAKPTQTTASATDPLEISSDIEPTAQTKKRGRPATGKRSDPGWIGRTFYVQKETDLDIEGELFQLKRQGMDVDKSELVDSLLAAWVKWQKSKNSDFPTGEILPIQNPENS
jgi:hypothetical protein